MRYSGFHTQFSLYFNMLLRAYLSVSAVIALHLRFYAYYSFDLSVTMAEEVVSNSEG